MHFIWDPKKAAANARKHRVSFEEASTSFADSLAITGADPDHSVAELRWITFGVSARGRLLLVSHTLKMKAILFASSAHGRLRRQNESYMKKAKSSRGDELRREYERSDFPEGFRRGQYAARFAAGTNIVRLDPEIAEAFPTSAAVNEALGTVLRAAKSARLAKRR